MADVTFRSEAGLQQLDAKGVVCLLIVLTDESADVRFDAPRDTGRAELARIGTIVMGMLQETGLFEQALRRVEEARSQMNAPAHLRE